MWPSGCSTWHPARGSRIRATVAKASSHSAFMPHKRTGGGNVPGRRLTVDSGVFNPELFKESRPRVSSSWAKSRLRDRLDAIIAHEHTEAASGGHLDAIRDSADTRLPIREAARRLLRIIAEGGQAG